MSKCSQPLSLFVGLEMLDPASDIFSVVLEIFGCAQICLWALKYLTTPKIFVGVDLKLKFGCPQIFFWGGLEIISWASDI